MRAVSIAAAAYAVVFFFLGVDRYITYHSGADLGIFTQAIANAADGMRDTYEHGSHFAFHFSPILYLGAPLLWLTHSAVALIGVQAAATSLVAPALYLIARKRTSERNAIALACIALLYPPLQGVTFTDFHEDAFAPAAVAWLLWAIDARRFGVAAALLAVVLSIKEDQAPAMVFLGLAGLVYFGGPSTSLALRARYAQDDKAGAARIHASAARIHAGVARIHAGAARIHARTEALHGVAFGALAVVASSVVFFGYFLVVRPMAGAHGSWIPEHFYAWDRGAPAIPAWKQLAGRLTYLLEAFAPLAFIPFRSRVLLLALPGFAEVLASREPLTYTMGQHYAAVWIPYVLVAFVIAGARLLGGGERRGIVWVRASLALSLLVTIFFSPLHLGHFLGRRSAADAEIDRFIARLPASASVGTYDEIYAHLGLFPNAAVGVKARPEFLLYDTHYHSIYWDGTVLPQIERALRRGEYRVFIRRRGIVVLRRSFDFAPSGLRSE